MKYENGDTIVFKSTKSMFIIEQNGDKSNTVRLLTGDELAMFQQSDVPTRIKIVCASDPSISFTRCLTDITRIGEMLGAEIYVLSWRTVEI